MCIYIYVYIYIYMYVWPKIWYECTNPLDETFPLSPGMTRSCDHLHSHLCVFDFPGGSSMEDESNSQEKWSPPRIKHGWLENGPFIGEFPIKTSIHRGFSTAMFG